MADTFQVKTDWWLTTCVVNPPAVTATAENAGVSEGPVCDCVSSVVTPSACSDRVVATRSTQGVPGLRPETVITPALSRVISSGEQLAVTDHVKSASWLTTVVT